MQDDVDLANDPCWRRPWDIPWICGVCGETLYGPCLRQARAMAGYWGQSAQQRSWSQRRVGDAVAREFVRYIATFDSGEQERPWHTGFAQRL